MQKHFQFLSKQHSMVTMIST